MLLTTTSNPGELQPKIADFGLARALDLKSRMETRTFGTITHMPPELLSSDVISKVFLQTSSFSIACAIACSTPKLHRL